MPTIEAGVFIGFVLAAFSGLVFVGRLPYLFILSAIIFAGLSLLMFGYYDVTQTEVETHRAANGTITGTIEHESPIINSNHETWGWIFMAMSIGTTIFFFKVRLG